LFDDLMKFNFGLYYKIKIFLKPRSVMRAGDIESETLRGVRRR